ncbi:hypothetical protein C8A05DRAFT_20105 [Staphylotrichum tortipilum]|uniref:Aminoglycoside phosphotransferase domain-containing protein n=1 Tax=Staphylotrichum tortipilum TaxID=2831512 RepID=A0AAN6RNK0_9PEZI|nr:hypothetical protein C8A05DRAFT_20105 [Staphylotrichum longicolle]
MQPPDDENAEARLFAQKVSEEEICEGARTRPGEAPHFSYPHSDPLVWVKFGNPWEKGTEAEANMQMLAWEWIHDERQAGRCSAAIHIPEVFRTFTDKYDTFYIIMELVRGTVLAKSVFANPEGSLHPVEECYDLIAEALELLRRMPTPNHATPGPYTPDPSLRLIRHPMFKFQCATIVYQNVDELEQHINTVISRSYPRKPSPLPTVTLERDLVFTYSDLNDQNFMFNTDSVGRLRLYLVDFEHASFLPLSFLALAILRNDCWWTAKPIAQRLGAALPQSNLEALTRARYTFRTFGSGVGLHKKDDGWSLTP